MIVSITNMDQAIRFEPESDDDKIIVQRIAGLTGCWWDGEAIEIDLEEEENNAS